jgi:2-oxoisovalerate ferredoxin oxidoreductase beta subunit
VIFVNNGIYGMTGGQMAPTTPLGRKTTTSPLGRDALNEGFPVHVCEMLNSLQAPVYIERVSLGNSKQIMHAAKVVKRAVENQVKGLGFSFVEVLSPCPTIWKMQPVEAKHFVQDEMAAVFPVCNLRDRTKEAPARPPAAAAPALEDLPRLLDLVNPTGEQAAATHPPRELDLRIKVAGFGGQGVLMLGEVLAEAGLDAGYEVSWLPSYGPEMRSGTSNCHVRLGNHAIDSPLVSCPNVLLALNEPSLRKFLPAVEEGGIALYNGSEIPGDCVRRDVRMVALPFTELADQMGAAKVGNIVMLGALLEATGMLDQDRVVGALKRLVHPRFFDLDVAALARGRQEFRDSASDDCLWGV